MDGFNLSEVAQRLRALHAQGIRRRVPAVCNAIDVRRSEAPQPTQKNPHLRRWFHCEPKPGWSSPSLPSIALFQAPTRKSVF